MTDLIIERRRARSPLTQDALQLQLEAACSSWGFDAMVLTDDEGQVLAGAGLLADPIAAPETQAARGRVSLDLAALRGGRARAAVRPIQIDGLRGQIIVLAAPDHPVDDAVAHTARGIERILRTTHTTAPTAPTHFVL